MPFTNDFIPIAECFNGIYHLHKVQVKARVGTITVKIKADSGWASLNEIRLFIGQDSPSYDASDLMQDSSRTWILLNPREGQNTTIDEVHVTGNAHLVVYRKNESETMTISKLVGDFTGTMHIGQNQTISVQSTPNSIVSESVYSYKVIFAVL